MASLLDREPSPLIRAVRSSAGKDLAQPFQNPGSFSADGGYGIRAVLVVGVEIRKEKDESVCAARGHGAAWPGMRKSRGATNRRQASFPGVKRGAGGSSRANFFARDAAADIVWSMFRLNPSFPAGP